MISKLHLKNFITVTHLVNDQKQRTVKGLGS